MCGGPWVLGVSMSKLLKFVASFPAGLSRSFCSSVCVDNNTRMQKSGEEWGRPHHVSDVSWTQGGREGGGGGGGGVEPVDISVGPEAVHHTVGSVGTLRG